MHALPILEVVIDKRADKYYDMREKRATSESERYIKTKC